MRRTLTRFLVYGLQRSSTRGSFLLLLQEKYQVSSLRREKARERDLRFYDAQISFILPGYFELSFNILTRPRQRRIFPNAPQTPTLVQLKRLDFTEAFPAVNTYFLNVSNLSTSHIHIIFNQKISQK